MSENNHKPLSISIDNLQNIIESISYCNDGDPFEKKYGDKFKQLFPRCEEMWRYFVIPATCRIDESQKYPSYRSGVSDLVKGTNEYHYSMFIKFIYANNHIQNFELSSFDDFYSSLGSVCDLAEEFLLQLYRLILACNEWNNDALDGWSKDYFLKKAEEWYDLKYSEVYEHYHSKGKFHSLKMPNGENVLDSYFVENEPWRKYKRESKKIREYRNVIIHRPKIGNIFTSSKLTLVPRKECIQKYKQWDYIFSAAKNKSKRESDFIDMKVQMKNDLEILQISLNNLWKKPLEDIKSLLLKERNQNFLKLYNLEITG